MHASRARPVPAPAEAARIDDRAAPSADPDPANEVLAVEDLEVRFDTPDGPVPAVRGLSFAIGEAEALGVVGESGCGKSQAFLAVLGLLASNGRATGSARFRGAELIGLPPQRLNRIRGARIAMIFQDPMTSLNPYLTIATQMTEVLTRHQGMTGRAARRRAVELLDRVRIPDAARRLEGYPHELSGGMRQRVMIAMALLCEPDLLIADEPTTALDVTVQAQILELFADLRRELHTAIVLITHDLGVIAGLADRVAVMYAGRIVESAPVRDLFYQPRHPYTGALLASMPRLSGAAETLLPTIPGQPPSPERLPPGCSFQPRCRHAFDRCTAEDPALRPAGRGTKACHLEDP